ncbi:unnamed protein product [Prorocentrum cordatum]|uniref:Uncharacterized protein n=1 Tax=Prorocentrum cordatum TaxID=2364126 RepID=A0ABN9QX82_9DINO|nr:unnamed protein product [Polarella glacialis]
MRWPSALLPVLAATHGGHGGPAGGRCDGLRLPAGASAAGRTARADSDSSCLLQRTGSLFSRTLPPESEDGHHHSGDAYSLPEGGPRGDGDSDQCAGLLALLAAAGDAWLSSRCGWLLGPSPPAPCLAVLEALGERPWGPDAFAAGCRELLRSPPARLLVRGSRRPAGGFPAVAALQGAASAASAADRSERLVDAEGQDARQALTGPLWPLDAALAGKSAGVTYDGQTEEALGPYPALNCENMSFENNTDTGVDHVAVARAAARGAGGESLWTSRA